MFVPYTNPHFWTDRNQTLHTSPPWSGRDHRVCMGPQYFIFTAFSTYFVVSGCQFVHSRWLPAPHCTAAVLYPWRSVCRCDVTHGGLCNEKAEKGMECVCVKMETWWDGWKWLMNWTCNCIAFIQMIMYNLSNFRLSFFRSLSTDNTFFHLPNLSRRSVKCFANGMTRQCCQPWQSHVCRKPLCLYTLLDLLTLFRPFWEMFREGHDNTDPCYSHGQLYVACSRFGNPTNIYIPAPEGKTKNFSDISNRW